MISFFQFFMIGISILIGIEFSIYVNTYFAISLNEDKRLADIFRGSTYRFFWKPKISVEIIQLLLFIFSAKYYKEEYGSSCFPAVLCLLLLTIFSFFVFVESLKSFRRKTGRDF